MKVALFHTTLPQPGRKHGGVETNVHRLANALVEHEHLSVTVFSCDAKPADAKYAHTTLFEGRYGGKLARLTLLPAALNFVDFSAFDVLHLNGDDWFFVRRQVPTVRTFHGSALQEGRFAPGLKQKAMFAAIYPCEQLAARLATVTLAVGTEAQAIYGTDALADNGVDTGLFSPRSKATYPLLFYIGTWAGRKRGAFAYETFVTQILPKFPDARLYMACDRVPPHDAVIDGGAPDDKTVAEWIAKAWVFIYPSLYEGFGIPYIEALAAGTAIVTTKNSGADYVLDRGRYGAICTDAEFGPRIAELLADNDLRAKMELGGRERARQYAWPVVARKHADIYRSAIQRK